MRDVHDLLTAGRPVLVLPYVGERRPVWMRDFRVDGFVLTDGETVLRKHAHASPFIANAMPQLTMLALGPELLQWFDRRAATQPRTYVDILQLVRFASALGPVEVPAYAEARLSMDEADDDLYRGIWHFCERVKAQFGKGGVHRAFGLYADQYLKATVLLDLMAGRGYHVGDPYGAPFKAEDGLVHPSWHVPAIPGRITTAAPPFHAIPRTQWDALQARPGSRWVRLVWPGIVTEIAKRVTARLAPALPDLVQAVGLIQPCALTDWLMGAHHVPEPEAKASSDFEQRVGLLQAAWAKTETLYPLPVPRQAFNEPPATLSAGKRALMAAGAFTVAQLAAMHDAFVLLRHRSLTGLSDVIPGLGTLSFQIDDRVPLGAIEQYVLAFHNHYLQPDVLLGTHWGSLLPLSHPHIEVALQLERPTQMPVQCPVCFGVADSERDLATHFLEDHPQLPVEAES